MKFIYIFLFHLIPDSLLTSASLGFFSNGTFVGWSSHAIGELPVRRFNIMYSFIYSFFKSFIGFSGWALSSAAGTCAKSVYPLGTRPGTSYWFIHTTFPPIYDTFLCAAYIFMASYLPSAITAERPVDGRDSGFCLLLHVVSAIYIYLLAVSIQSMFSALVYHRMVCSTLFFLLFQAFMYRFCSTSNSKTYIYS